jgi:hypothetical protein
MQKIAQNLLLALAEAGHAVELAIIIYKILDGNLPKVIKDPRGGQRQVPITGKRVLGCRPKSVFRSASILS